MLAASQAAITSIGPEPIPVCASMPDSPTTGTSTRRGGRLRAGAAHGEAAAGDRRPALGPVERDRGEVQLAPTAEQPELLGPELEAKRPRLARGDRVGEALARAVEPRAPAATRGAAARRAAHANGNHARAADGRADQAELRCACALRAGGRKRVGVRPLLVAVGLLDRGLEPVVGVRALGARAVRRVARLLDLLVGYRREHLLVKLLLPAGSAGEVDEARVL